MQPWESDLRDQIRSGSTAYLKIKVKPNAPQTQIGEYLPDHGLKISIKAPPEKSKANKEIEKFFRKYMRPLRVEVTIVGGQTGREKLLKFVPQPHSR